MNWVLKIMSCTPVGTAGQTGKMLISRPVGTEAYIPG